MNIKTVLEHLYSPDMNWYFSSNKTDIYTYLRGLNLMMTLSSATPESISIIFESQEKPVTLSEEKIERKSYTIERHEIQDYLDKIFTDIKQERFKQSTYKQEAVKETYDMVVTYLISGQVPPHFNIEKQYSDSEKIHDLILNSDKEQIFIRLANAASDFKPHLSSALQSLKIGVVSVKDKENIYFEILLPRYEMEQSAILSTMFNLSPSSQNQEEFIYSLMNFESPEIQKGMQKMILELKLDNRPNKKKAKI